MIRKNKNMLHYEWSQGKENKQTPTNTRQFQTSPSYIFSGMALKFNEI